ncbi:Ran BP2/NZF zinc finger-like superfamily protein [Euphorbia peplus]|nr:Ran BP2/NZF zinc finger-like superfamily protein [Euphorbia peplus]
MSWSAGDWMCSACEHQNFRKREGCQRCGYPKFEGPDPSTWNRLMPGDWFCSCGAHNYAARPACYKCAALKIVYSSAASHSHPTLPPGWKSGDWICLRIGCGEHNYANRAECFRCKTPKN